MSSNGIDWEEDEVMLYLLKRKRRLEELEDYNMPEVMIRKRQAVKEEARRTPAPEIPTTELDFDDDVWPSEFASLLSQRPLDDSQGQGEAERIQSNGDRQGRQSATTRSRSLSKRARRRSRCAMRKRALKAQQQQQDRLVTASR